MLRHLLLSVTTAVVLAMLGALGLATATAADSHPADATAAAFQPATADRAALTALVQMQDPTTGLWPIPHTGAWWSSANDLTALIDAERALGSHTYDGMIARTYDRYVRPACCYPFRDFTNHYYDDSLWWGLAWLDAYRWTGDVRYLAVAEVDDAYVHSARIAGTCGAGIPWAMSTIHDGSQLNAITNELGMELAGELATATGWAAYLREALADWAWLQRSGLIGRDDLVRDHLDAYCRPVGPVWSYNQGTLSAGLTALAAATGDMQYLRTSRHLAGAATASAVLNPAGILTDPCETLGVCAVDGPTFKGADVRGLGQLNAALPDHPYTAYLTRQAATMFAGDRLVDNTYGQHWTGPAPWANAATQGSAVDLLTATMGGA